MSLSITKSSNKSSIDPERKASRLVNFDKDEYE
jgi:hypothetical protein